MHFNKSRLILEKVVFAWCCALTLIVLLPMLVSFTPQPASVPVEFVRFARSMSAFMTCAGLPGVIFAWTVWIMLRYFTPRRIEDFLPERLIPWGEGRDAPASSGGGNGEEERGWGNPKVGFPQDAREARDRWTAMHPPTCVCAACLAQRIQSPPGYK